MTPLTSEHIDYIIKDLHYRGIIYETLQDELVDHVCSGVEKEMAQGMKFIEAYREVLKTFGHTAGLRETQKETYEVENQKANIMFKNYLKIAVRTLTKQRFYSVINISGLAVGIASCLVILLFVLNELSYDRYHEKADRIHRINCEILFGGNHLRMSLSPAPLAAGLAADYPEVELAVRFWNPGSYLVKRSVENIKENNVVFADPDIFKVFTFSFLSGNPENALKDPNSVVISKRTADKFFPHENALGQQLILDNHDNYKVTGVYEDLPVANHFHFDLILSMEGNEDARKNVNWLSNNYNTYVLLREGARYEDLQAKFPKMIDKYIGPLVKVVLGPEATMEKFYQAGNKLEYTIMPLTDIHLHSDLTGDFEPNSDITYVYLFSAVALFILIIACINFMNLSTARSANRAREVGVRKVMGSFRSHLIRQFLTESILLSLFSFLLAVGIALLAMPLFNGLSGKQLTIPLTNPTFYALLFAGAVLTGLFAGLYPSFFLSAFKPVNVLKGNLSLGMKSGFIRSALVVFQFAISIVLVVGTLTVQRQLSFIQNKKIGFSKDQVIVIHDAYALGEQLQSFKNEVLKNAMISSGTISGFLPVSGTSRSDNTYWPEGAQPTQENMVSIQNWAVDYDYIKTLGMKIKQGRDFSPEFPSDSNSVILNESAAKMFEITDNPAGKKISTFSEGKTPGSFDKERTRSFPVIGVLEDFHFESLKQNITPLCLFLRRSRGLVSFRFEAKNTQDIIQRVEKTWKSFAPGQPFEYSFLDEDFGRMYSNEQRLGKIFGIFAGLAIIIACLGLFALTSFTSEQRTKEIGIRKVLGASVSSIVVLLSKEFGKLIVIAFVLAAPLAWLAVDWWLKNYTYKVEIGVMVYLMAGLFAFVIAWLTMSYQSIKAATSNPVNSLRSE